MRRNFLCAIGASTGGTEAIKAVLEGLPPESPPLVIAQHIPAAFSTSFARRLDDSCAIKVYEAEHNQVIEAGCAYLSPGDSHLRVIKVGSSGYVCKLDQSEVVNRHRPSVEVLYRSVQAAAGVQALGIMLTGMGADGAEALLSMRNAGCATVAQDKESSVVWGMPGKAVELGAAEKVLPLAKVGQYILHKAYEAG